MSLFFFCWSVVLCPLSYFVKFLAYVGRFINSFMLMPRQVGGIEPSRFELSWAANWWSINLLWLPLINARATFYLASLCLILMIGTWLIRSLLHFLSDWLILLFFQLLSLISAGTTCWRLWRHFPLDFLSRFVGKLLCFWLSLSLLLKINGSCTKTSTLRRVKVMKIAWF